MKALFGCLGFMFWAFAADASRRHHEFACGLYAGLAACSFAVALYV